MSIPDDATLANFQSTVYAYYRAFPRSMPWRETDDPYRILLSEIMLQQTQVSRVMAKYHEFVEAFPDVHSLAVAPVSRVLEVWLGLGYNRRALALHRLARELVARGGEVPDDPATLETLPGIGHATACAIAAYAFNRPVVFIETNIRSVFIHHFFHGRPEIADREILPLVEAALDRTNPRTHLKTEVPNPARRSSRHRRQSPFEGSHRQLRGRILRHLAHYGSQTVATLAYAVGESTQSTARTVRELEGEGFLAVRDDAVELHSGRAPQPPSLSRISVGDGTPGSNA
jgi:A/G-specific adenine glycosylase